MHTAESTEKKWYERISAFNVVACFLLAAVGSYSTMLVTQAETNSKLREHDKQIERTAGEMMPRREQEQVTRRLEDKIDLILTEVRSVRDELKEKRK